MARDAGGWAPWYHYVFVLAVAHAIVQATVLRDTGEVTRAVASIVLTAVLMIAVTAVWRSRRDRSVR